MTAVAQTTSESHGGVDRVVVAVLAAGHGKRMKSASPKHLQPVGGVPIVERVIRAGLGVSPDNVVAVVSRSMADLPDRLGMAGAFETVIQDSADGTAAAVMCALDHVGSCAWLIAVLGDIPLVTTDIISMLLDRAMEQRLKVNLLSAIILGAAGYGRIERNAGGQVTRIVEARNDDPDHRRGAIEINSGIMVLDAQWARRALDAVRRNDQTDEFMLTDLVEIAVGEASVRDQWPVGATIGEPASAVGVNDRRQLAEADAVVRQRTRHRLMDDGVTLLGPETIFIDESVQVGRDSIILPHSIISGRTTIGSDCTIGPHAVIHESQIGDAVTIVNSTVRDSRIDNGSDVGPYAHLRQHVQIGPGVHVGTSTEIKNSSIGPHSRIGHFSYVGDATIGTDVNIGAGVVTANYDGESKHQTLVGDHAFIGSDSVLVAPVSVGDNARTGAGSVVNRDVAAGTTVAGVPARVLVSRQQRFERPDGVKTGE